MHDAQLNLESSRKKRGLTHFPARCLRLSCQRRRRSRGLLAQAIRILVYSVLLIKPPKGPWFASYHTTISVEVEILGLLIASQLQLGEQNITDFSISLYGPAIHQAGFYESSKPGCYQWSSVESMRYDISSTILHNLVSACS